MKVNDLITLKQVLTKTKVGQLPNEKLRSYLKLSLALSKYEGEFESRRDALVKETAANLNYDLQTLTPEQNRDIINVVAPILDEYLGQDVEDVTTNILDWDTLYECVLNLSDNVSLTTKDKEILATYLIEGEI